MPHPAFNSAMAARASQSDRTLSRIVLESTVVGTLAGGAVGLLLRIYLSRLGVLNLDWSLFVFFGMAVGFLSGFERRKVERLRREKNFLESQIADLEKSLQVTHNRHREFLARFPDWLFQIDPEGRLLESNRSSLDIFHQSWEQWKSRPFFDLFPRHLQAEIRRAFQAAAASFIQVLEMEIAGREGDPRYFILILHPNRDPGGSLTGVSGIMRDVGEKKRLEKELLQAEKMAALGTMSACIAHELRNPLGVIRTAVYNLERRLPDKDARMTRHLSNINEKIEEADKIITNLLNFSRLPKAALVETDLDALLEDAARRTAEQFPGSGVAVKKGFQPLPPVRVDRVQMGEVFQNLLKNAYEAMGEEGTLSLSTSAEPDGSGIKISIGDTGSGIPPLALSQLSAPFFSTKAKGIGLGLTLSYRIIEQVHGGNISVASEPGKGTTFTIKLPKR